MLGLPNSWPNVICGLERSSRTGEGTASEMNILKYSNLIMAPLPGFRIFHFSRMCYAYTADLKKKFFYVNTGFPGGSDGKESACSAGDLGSIPRSGRSPGEGNDYSLQ